MQIRVTEAEIRAGLAMYLISRGFLDVTPENLKCTFVQGRKPKGGLSAEIEELSTPSAPPVQTVEPEEVKYTGQADLQGKVVIYATTGQAEIAIKPPQPLVVEDAVVEQVEVEVEPVAEEQAETVETAVVAEEPATTETTAALFG